MKQVTPCKTVARVMLALDNGGRFFNLLTALEMTEFHKARFPKPLGYQGGQISALLFSSQSLEAYLPRIKPRSLIIRRGKCAIDCGIHLSETFQPLNSGGVLNSICR